MFLDLSKTYNFPTQIIFEAWTNPELLKKWFSPSANWKVGSASVDPRPGGKYSFTMLSDNQEKWTVEGEYKEVIKNKKLVFTWTTNDVKDTLVTVDFKDLGNKTEVSLKHDLLPNQAQVAEHEYGWVGCMKNLEESLQK
ncbi:MAG: SRPBCC domain-containing protein [Pseudobdellovibrionaceae bacterium]